MVSVAIALALIAVLLVGLRASADAAERLRETQGLRDAFVLASVYIVEHDELVPGPDESAESSPLFIAGIAVHDTIYAGIGRSYWPTATGLDRAPLRDGETPRTVEQRYWWHAVEQGLIETSILQSLAFFEHPSEFDVSAPGAAGYDGATQRVSRVRYPSSKGYLFDILPMMEFADRERGRVIAADGSLQQPEWTTLAANTHPRHMNNYTALAPVGGVLGRDW